VVVAGVVVGPGDGAAAGVELPRLGAGDHPAHDRADAGDVVVAVAVAEGGAAVLAVAAAAALAHRVAAPAHPGGAAPAVRGLLVAVHVVASRTVAEVGVVDLPPAGEDRVRRAGVLAVDRAAELRVPVAAQAAAVAAATEAGAHGGVRAGGTEHVGGPGHGEGAAHDGGPREEPTAVRVAGQDVADSIDELCGDHGRRP